LDDGRHIAPTVFKRFFTVCGVLPGQILTFGLSTSAQQESHNIAFGDNLFEIEETGSAFNYICFETGILVTILSEL
jgi:hypothetical protein